jgi:hypothetical protein
VGRSGARFRDPHHAYAGDLDLFGEGSLFELLCAARTSMGEDTLAAWLLAPADPASVRARQQAVQALTPDLDLREDLAILGEEVAATVHRDTLATLAAPARPPAMGLRLGAAALSAVTLLAFASWAAGWAPPILALAALAIQGVVAWRLQGHVRDADRAVAGHGPDLERVAEVLARFERAPLGSPLLDRLHADLVTEGRRPSQTVRALRIWVDLLDSRRNQFFVPFALLTMWGVHCALAIEDWRARHGASVEAWLAAVGHLEALCSLAGFAWEHPADVYPIVEEGEARFEAEALGHPLISEERCVRNDVALGGATRVLIVSGSNMSGKSTLLRSVGTNAGAGAGGRAGAGVAAPALPAFPGCHAAHPGFAAGGHLSVLRGARPATRPRPHRGRADPVAVPARRDPPRDQLARSAPRGGRHRARPRAAGRHRPRHHPRPGPVGGRG